MDRSFQQLASPLQAPQAKSVIRFTRILIFFLCLAFRVAVAQAYGPDFAPTDAPGTVDFLPSSFTRIDGMLRDLKQPSKKTFALELGPKLVELKATYWEKRKEESPSLGILSGPDPAGLGRYFNLFATLSPFNGSLVGESEIAYSTLAFSSLTEPRPIMSRLGAGGRWDKASYGVAYRSFGRGFVSLTGAKVEHDRDESQLWGEYDFGLVRVRSAAMEAWEQNSTTNDITLTRTAAASVQLAKPEWSALFSSSSSWIGRGEESGNKAFAFANGLALVYRAAALFMVEPSVNFRHEWDRAARLKTGTPSAGLALAYTPSRDLQLIGRASYARDLSDDPVKHASIVNTTAGLNWKIGNSFLGEKSLSMQLEYKNESRPIVPDTQQSNLTGTVQFKIAGF